MDPDGGVRGAGTARDEGDAGPAGQLAERLGHVRRAAFLAADHEPQPIGDVVQRVEHGEITFARNAERMRRALREQARDEDFATGTRGHRAESLLWMPEVRIAAILRRPAL